MRIRLNLSYDGSAFQGWQLQPDAPTVQGAIEEALRAFYGGREVRIMGSGRTDTGVHAVGQVAHFDAPVERESYRIVRGVNALLPDGVRIWGARGVAEDFHARFSARERTYAYRILNREDLFLGRIGWHVPYEFDPVKAREFSTGFLGCHDFRAFSTRPDDDESTQCDIRRLDWVEDRDGWVVWIAADRYLRRMVRTIVGTLVEMAAGRLDREALETLLLQGSGRAGVPAPPQGLALMRVRYDIDNSEDSPPRSPWGVIA